MNIAQLRSDLYEFDKAFMEACKKIKAYLFPKTGGGWVDIDYSDWTDEGIAVMITFPANCGCCRDDEYNYTIPTNVVTDEGLKAYIDEWERDKQKALEEIKANELLSVQKQQEQQKELLRKLASQYPDVVKELK